jgi:hypothetical protein
MAFPGGWNVANAIESDPGIRYRVVAPNIIKPLEAVSPAKSITVSLNRSCSVVEPTSIICRYMSQWSDLFLPEVFVLEVDLPHRYSE